MNARELISSLVLEPGTGKAFELKAGQIMRIEQKVASYSLDRADILRKAMGKKKREVLEKECDGFSDGMKSNGFSAAAVKATAARQSRRVIASSG